MGLVLGSYYEASKYLQYQGGGDAESLRMPSAILQREVMSPAVA